MLTVQQSPPEARLLPFVRTYVQREAHTSGAELVEPVVARLGSILEFQFADPYQVPLYGLDLPNPSQPIAVIGPITERKARIVMSGHVQALSVIFQPLGLYALFGVPIAPLTDFGFEGHSILGSNVSALHQQLGNTNNFADRTVLLNHFFVHRLAQSHHNGAIDTALKLLTSPQRQVKVSNVALSVGLSSRQLERLSLQCLGMSPLLAVRIARFRRAMRMKAAGTSSWTDIAHAARYHDQMHLIRDVRAFAGDSPVRAFEQMKPQHLSRLGL